MKLLRPPPPPPTTTPTLTPDDDLYPADDFCFVCRDGGQLILCDVAGCRKVYHPPCVRLESVPQGTWHCPYHECSVCRRRVADDAAGSRQCAHCPTAYCSEHVPSALLVNVVGETLCPQCRQQEEEDSIDLLGRYSARRAFVKRVQMTLKRDSRQLIRMPRMQSRPLDLLALYREVRQRGGVAAVMVRLGWRGVMRALGLGVTDRSQHLVRRWYLSVLYAYEKHFYAGFVPLTNTQSVATQHANGEDDLLLAQQVTLSQSDDPSASSLPLGGAAAAKKRKRAKEEQLQQEADEAAAAAAAAAGQDGLGGVEGDDEPEEVVVLIRNVPVTTAVLPTSKKKRRRGHGKQEQGSGAVASSANGSNGSGAAGGGSSRRRDRERSRVDGIEFGTDDRIHSRDKS